MPIQCIVSYTPTLPGYMRRPFGAMTANSALHDLIAMKLNAQADPGPVDLTAVAATFYCRALFMAAYAVGQSHEVLRGMLKALAFIPAWATERGQRPQLADVMGSIFELGGEIIEAVRLQSPPGTRRLYLLFVLAIF